MEFVNLCPHQIDVIRADGSTVSYVPSGTVARCSQTERVVDEVDGIVITTQSFGEITGLPDPVDGTMYIVSRLVAAAVPERHDLVIPGPLVRNPETGQPSGCRGLSVL